MIRFFLFSILSFFLLLGSAHARPYAYPQLRYEGVESKGMGGVVLPLSDETGNCLFNNPAGLAKNTKFRGELLNFTLEANDAFLTGSGFSSTKMFDFNGLAPTLNQSTGIIYGSGASNLTALSWGGLGVGLLYQEKHRAVSDGTNVYFETRQLFVPAVGYGLSLARGVMKIGYSLQWVNESTGSGSTPVNTPGSFYGGLREGSGMAHHLSTTLAFPYTFLPTLTVLARNLGGLHYSFGKTLMGAAKNATQAPADEAMSVDASLNFMVRVSSEFKTFWYFQYLDATGVSSLNTLDRFSLGIDVAVSPHFEFRFGGQGLRPSAGISYRSESSEIHLAWSNETVPFSGSAFPTTQTNFNLQYKLYFQKRNTRNREQEK